MQRCGAHLVRLTALAVALFAAAQAVALSAVPPSPRFVGAFGPGAVPIDGKWQFHLGDDPAWAAPGLDDSGWEQLLADRPWGRQGHAGYHGFAWYRRHIALEPAAGATPQFALLLPEVGQAYEVYWNGTLVGQRGSLPPHPVWFEDQGPHVYPLERASTGVLSLRVWNAPPLSDEDPGLTGGFLSTPLVGTPVAIAAAKDALDFQWLRSRQFLFTETLLNGLVALLSLLAWARNRDQWILFWMAGFTLPSASIVLLLHCRAPIPYVVSMGLDQPIAAVRDVSMWFLLLWLLDLRSDRHLVRITRWLAIVSVAAGAIDGLLVAVAWHPRVSQAAQTGDALMTVVNTLTQLFPLLLVGYVIGKRKRLSLANSAVAFSALLVEMAIAVRDASAQGRRFTHWSLRDLIDGPFVTVSGSAISVMDILQVLLFLCIVYAVYTTFLEHRQREMQIEQELMNARELQRVLVPDPAFNLPGFHLSSAYRPAQEVGGDFFQVIPLEDRAQPQVLIVLGDVSGKGMRAAMSVSFILGALRSLAKPAGSPSELLRELNARISGHLQGAFATCLVLRVDQDGSCVVASAGHPGPFIDDREMVLPGALPVGIIAGVEYEDVRFQLQPRQTCVLYTDGLLEAQNRAGEIYGFSRLASMFGRRPSAAQAADSAVYFGQNDDITVVSLTRHAIEESPAPDSALTQELKTTLGSGEPAAIG